METSTGGKCDVRQVLMMQSIFDGSVAELGEVDCYLEKKEKTGMERSSHIQQGLQTGESWSPLSRFMGWGVLWIWIASNVLLQYPLAVA